MRGCWQRHQVRGDQVPDGRGKLRHVHGRALQDISQSRLPLYLDRGWKRNAFLRQVEGNDAPALPTNITEARFTEDVANERINFRGVKADFASMLLFRLATTRRQALLLAPIAQYWIALRHVGPEYVADGLDAFSQNEPRALRPGARRDHDA